MKTGLIVGKFAPLHQGHQYLIETALAEVERLVVLVYDCPEVIEVPLKVRVDWIRELYPEVEVVEGYGAPTEHGDSPEITRRNIEFVKSSLLCPITHVFSSEWYGEILARELGAENFLVDKERVRVSVSGSEIRQNPEKYKNFLNPVVLRDFLKKNNDSR
ncbi:MAG: putative ATPase/kinase involved in NAD metabolism [Candidatus Uhrbacteria bacterium GW2011_GWE2_45_35]|uniref:Putative ATPase/kinase involved in NAD metabolism n=2 Tax=Candidatus Uhriibacteriota TaxID=1752732 RepID=A0A0G1LN66_9BACT|nr:MAG: putative ATPase/kinase involved in NAD metabolism [Candidatus Uhrbacteria bacterium GW2011_GWF2_44_350]KKU06885.1 MAG: putative ATPase/kinase involved in NAD metabolism [Candidatus Uhrbacteria bacterium GW2011_GWE2_45_35]HBR81011.1 hypothetical protein [Candidatus Uhrbacteria bacterium]HCU32079.1 hypothetical protein [Candidatus Uhrbacteria bacterium]